MEKIKVGGGFKLPPEGNQQAVCVGAFDVGNQRSNFNGEEKIRRIVVVAFELNERMEDGRRFIVYKRYTASFHEKATLRRDLESWAGKKFTNEELETLDPEVFCKGRNALVNIVHDGEFANVSSVSSLLKGMEVMKVEHDPAVDLPYIVKLREKAVK